MAVIGGYVKKQITSKVDLFELIMQQNGIESEFNRKCFAGNYPTRYCHLIYG